MCAFVTCLWVCFFELSDNPLHARDKIFGPFHRLDTDDNRITRAVAPGLRVVIGMFALNGGAIPVESTPGDGSTVKVISPLPGQNIAAFGIISSGSEQP
jgi:K+-sensing histidine kinase KdpD